MGAAASVRMLYKDALGWFKQYIDTETYMEDFKSMDRHNENALSFADVQHWITMKGRADPSWSIFLTSGPVLTIAHKYACKHGDTHTSVSASKMVNVTEFKTLLVHLFAFSILWSHFQNAEKWEESGADLAGHRLNFEAFKLACRTFDSANAHEELNDAQIKMDFELIDSNFSGSVGFIEVCNHCCKFIDDPEVEKRLNVTIPKFFGETLSHIPSDNLFNTLIAGPKTYFEVASIDEKNHELVSALIDKLDAQKDNLKSATALEHQNNIRKKYANIDDIINHPICFGFLRQFCESQHSDENLAFIRDVDEFRDLFAEDNNLWTTDWRDIDQTINVSEESTACDVLGNAWASRLDRSVAVDRSEIILAKYLHDDAQTQVCISKESTRKTLRRIEHLELYGPAVFDEACIDPIVTMNKDVLPRFRVSAHVSRMVMRVASVEPPPLPTSLKVPPPPENLLLTLCPIEAFPDSRMFTLDEIIGCHHLYKSFLEYLRKDKEQDRNNKLLCVRKVDIFEELLGMRCVLEAAEEAWQIFRYFGAKGSAYEVNMSGLDRKQIMHCLAEPQTGMFAPLRKAAYLGLIPAFEEYSKTSEYRGYPKLMRDLKIDPDGTKCPKLSVDTCVPVRRSYKLESPKSQKNSLAESLISSLTTRTNLRTGLTS